MFLIPTAGYDSYAMTGEAFHDPEADARLRRRAARRRLPRNIRIVERDLDIDDPAFATEAANDADRPDAGQAAAS